MTHSQERDLCKLAKVEKLMKESNERVRDAFVKIIAKNKVLTKLKCTIHHLYQLEINCLTVRKKYRLILVFQPEVVEEPQSRRKHPRERLHKKNKLRVALRNCQSKKPLRSNSFLEFNTHLLPHVSNF